MNWFEKDQKKAADAKKAAEGGDKKDAKADDKKADDKKADAKADDKKDAKADDKKADAKKEEKPAADKKADAKADDKKADAKADDKKADDKKPEKSLIQLEDHAPPPNLREPPTPTFLDANNCEHVYTSPRKVEDFGLDMDALCPKGKDGAKGELEEE